MPVKVELGLAFHISDGQKDPKKPNSCDLREVVQGDGQRWAKNAFGRQNDGDPITVDA